MAGVRLWEVFSAASGTESVGGEGQGVGTCPAVLCRILLKSVLAPI